MQKGYINCRGGGEWGEGIEDDGKISVRYMEVCRRDFPSRRKALHRDIES